MIDPQIRKRTTVAVGVAVTAAAAVALGSGTYAAFSTTRTGPGGTLSAGSLTLDVGGFETTDLFNTAIQPGQVVHRSITITNTGSVTGTLSEAFTMVGQENGCFAAEAAAGGCNARAGNLDEPDQLQASRDGTTFVPVRQMLLNGWQPPTRLTPGTSSTQEFFFMLPSNSHNNRTQSDRLRIQSVVSLNQS